MTSSSPAGRTGWRAGPPWPVVLVHGTRTSHSQWDLQLPVLHAAGHRVRAPDLPGHGARRGEAFTLEAAESVIEEAVRTAHAEAGLPVHLVGSSLGGMLAIHSAARLARAGGTHADPLGPLSDPLGSLVACGAALQPSPRGARLYAALIGLADRLPAMRTDADGALFARVLGSAGARAYLRGGRADLEVVAPAFAALASLDLRAALRTIPVPVVMMHGRRDQLRLHERSFVAAAPRGRLELLPYGDHMVNLKAPGRFGTDLLRVLARSQREQGAQPDAS